MTKCKNVKCESGKVLDEKTGTRRDCYRCDGTGKEPVTM